METFQAIDAVVGLWFLMWLLVGALFDRRRCVVCELRVRRRHFRAARLWTPKGWGVAHRDCAVPSDAAIQRVLRK